MKKQNDQHEQDKANVRAIKTKQRDWIKNQFNIKGRYKTHEKRSHRPSRTHYIQQPMK